MVALEFAESVVQLQWVLHVKVAEHVGPLRSLFL